MNCVENLPIFAAVVFCLTVAGADGGIVDMLALAVLLARICQTTIHLAFAQTNVVASARFTSFFIQAACMLALAAFAAIAAAG
jgi:uncharacterized MAPEG superfamily protein